MTVNELIESVESAQLFADLKELMLNIKTLDNLSEEERATLKYLGVDVNEVSFELKSKKDNYINMAIKKAYPKKWAIEHFGQGYAVQIEILKRSLPSRMAGLYGLENLEQKTKILE